MKKIFFIFIMALSICTINAQTTSPQLVNSSGDSFKNTNYQLDWSIGELQTETYNVSEQILTQGFHQNTYTVSTEVDQLEGFQFELNACPNPTTDFITIEWKEPSAFEKPESVLIITNMNGKVMQTDKLTKTNHHVDFLNYVVGTYFITILQNNKLVKSFKIIKN